MTSGMFLIDGEWMSTSQRSPVINPAQTSETVGEVALCSPYEVEQAITSAELAFREWSQTPISERVQRITTAAQALNQRIEEHVSLYVRENGKVLVEAKKEIARCVEVMTHGATTLPKWWEPEQRTGTQKVQFRKRPRGVTAVISPWNSPLVLTFKRAIPAILAGNTIVIKPATTCPLTLMSMFAIIAPHFPAGVINIVTGSGAKIGEQLCQDPRVRTIAFTGSTETGKTIMQQSASTLKNLYMELGGNDPALVLADAVLDEKALSRIRGGVLRAAGQVCSAIKRIYVHESRYDELLSKLTNEFQRVVVGNGLQPDATMGPLHNQSQFNIVSQLIEQAEQSGQVITAGQQLNPDTWSDGYFMLPRIVTGLAQHHPLVKVEQFGPIIPILTFREVEEAVALANDSEYGLRASVWTTDEQQAIWCADRLEAGAVFHNNHTIFQDLHLDFPGVKESGVSRETRWGGLELFADTYGFAD